MVDQKQIKDEVDDEATVTNLENISREGDLSPRTNEKSSKKGKKKSQN